MDAMHCIALHCFALLSCSRWIELEAFYTVEQNVSIRKELKVLIEWNCDMSELFDSGHDFYKSAGNKQRQEHLLGALQ